jgi:hypothetical protein
MNIAQVKENLIGMSHSGTLNKVRNFEALLERAINTVLSKVDPIDTERIVPLAQAIHDDIQNYSIASDYKKIIDLYPQDDRNSSDRASREYAEPFDATTAIRNKTLSIESNNGAKFLRVNWKSRPPVTIATMDSLTDDGSWGVVGTATVPEVDELVHLSGIASLKFNLVASGDGLQNTTLSPLDLSSWNDEEDRFMAFYFESVANLTSITGIWGNNLTTKFFTSVAQTAQFDGTAFQVGWNIVRFPGSTATETGTVDNSAYTAFKFTIAATGAINNIRAENITASLGRMFNMKYYSKYAIKNVAGTWLARTTSDDDVIVLDSDCINLVLFEALKNIAQQNEGEDSTFDLSYANKELHGDPSAPDISGRLGAYARYRSEHPSQAKKAVTRWSSGPRFRQ